MSYETTKMSYEPKSFHLTGKRVSYENVLRNEKMSYENVSRATQPLNTSRPAAKHQLNTSVVQALIISRADPKQCPTTLSVQQYVPQRVSYEPSVPTWVGDVRSGKFWLVFSGMGLVFKESAGV